MAGSIHFNANMTFNQLIELIRQLPQNQKKQLVSILAEETDFIPKEEVISTIKEGLKEVKLHKEGKIKLNTLDDFLAKN
jgi:Tfp pilus assembly protein PilN